MSNRFYISIIIIIFSQIATSQSRFIYTPNGKSVTVDTHTVSLKDLENFYGELSSVFGSDSAEHVIEWPHSVGEYSYNCHFFAWHNKQGHEKWTGSGDIWKNGYPSSSSIGFLGENTLINSFLDDEDDSEPEGYNSWIDCDSSDSDAAIVTYHQQSDSAPNHSARLLSNGDCI